MSEQTEMTKEEMVSELDNMHFEFTQLINKFGGKATIREHTAQETLVIVKNELQGALDNLKAGDIKMALLYLQYAFDLCDGE